MHPVLAALYILSTVIFGVMSERGTESIEEPFSCTSTRENKFCSGRSHVSGSHGSNRWAERTSADLNNVRMVVFPLGSVEQHGPHLPLGTDLLLADAFAEAVSSQTVLKLPASPFGASFEHAGFCGTIAIPDQPIHELWSAVISSVASTGIRAMLLLNAHGGQTSNAQIVARKARFDSQPPTLVTVVNLQALFHHITGQVLSDGSAANPKIDWKWESTYGVHGGLVETALMLYLFPSLVTKENIIQFVPRRNARGVTLEPHGAFISYGWETQDIAEDGALGDPRYATAELGEKIFTKTREYLIQLVEELAGAKPQDILLSTKKQAERCINL